MLVFPQMTTGAIGQFPIVRRRRFITVMNVLRDGSAVTYADSTPRTNFWELTLHDLSDKEADSIRQLFQTVEGRLGSFTFLDPTANLLAHSEELDSPSWTKDPLLQLNSSIDDPVGGVRAIRLINAGQSPQALTQSLDAPAWFDFCFSVYARSEAGSGLSLTRSSSTNAHTRVFTLPSTWTRCTLSGALNVPDGSVQFTLELPAGASVDLFGIQAEAQPSASAYKRSGSRSGVYSNARFDQDALRETSERPDQYRFDIRILAKD